MVQFPPEIIFIWTTLTFYDRDHLLLYTQNSVSKSCIFIPLHDTVNFIYFMFCCFAVIFAASVLIRLQPFRRMRHLVGLLCGVMVTQKPQASKTSEFNSVNDEKNKPPSSSSSEASLIQTTWESALLKPDNSNEGSIEAGLIENMNHVYLHAKTCLYGLNCQFST